MHALRLTKAVELVKIFSYCNDMKDTAQDKNAKNKDAINSLADLDLDALDTEDDLDEEFEETTTAKFFCPECGEIPRDEVLFICNNCESNEILYKDGVFVCPQCFYPGDNFECMRCGNRRVIGTFSN